MPATAQNVWHCRLGSFSEPRAVIAADVDREIRANPRIPVLTFFPRTVSRSQASHRADTQKIIGVPVRSQYILAGTYSSNASSEV